jgi:hypothetical protein
MPGFTKCALSAAALLVAAIPVNAGPADQDALCDAIRRGDRAEIRSLVERGVNPAAPTSKGRPAIGCAGKGKKADEVGKFMMGLVADKALKDIGIEVPPEEESPPPAPTKRPTGADFAGVRFLLREAALGYLNPVDHKRMFRARLEAGKEAMNQLIGALFASEKAVSLPVGTTLTMTGRATGAILEVTAPGQAAPVWVVVELATEAGVKVPPPDPATVEALQRF